ncbi:hypothetical protein SAMN05421810_107155 [Amycolatopsis arida]|uniref:Uncharacterized protein n=1 Tax=Amycolatopsis arida TaxID=587909 RepID=A0A1I5YH31_9PSEU|nr:hypothetical protein [Amycolatopsis arida]TDX90509.1 hypothetical protein CLV69_107155 [Amycolatopsis arida]SFQ43495.1 hypothetical protein SAMN05421810_107155 [Amycolatopsis arida]
MSSDSTTETRVHRSITAPPPRSYRDHAATMRGVFDSPGGWSGTLARFAGLAGADTAEPAR